MSYKDFVQQINQHVAPVLSTHGYMIARFPGWKTHSVIFRKVINPWYIFVDFQYSRRSLPQLHRFDIQTMRLSVDEPYQLHIRDGNGKYIPGSLVGHVSSPEGPGWLYQTDQELAILLTKAMQSLFVELQRLEDPVSTMNYT